MAKDAKIITKPKPKCIGNGNFSKFKTFGLTDGDFELGLRHLKAEVKKRYRVLIKKCHPDKSNQNGEYFQILTTMYNRIIGLTVMPLTIDNLETVLEIDKGYLSTYDVVLPWERW